LPESVSGDGIKKKGEHDGKAVGAGGDRPLLTVRVGGTDSQEWVSEKKQETGGGGFGTYRRVACTAGHTYRKSAEGSTRRRAHGRSCIWEGTEDRVWEKESRGK